MAAILMSLLVFLIRRNNWSVLRYWSVLLNAKILAVITRIHTLVKNTPLERPHVAMERSYIVSCRGEGFSVVTFFCPVYREAFLYLLHFASLFTSSYSHGPDVNNAPFVKQIIRYYIIIWSTNLLPRSIDHELLKSLPMLKTKLSTNFKHLLK